MGYEFVARMSFRFPRTIILAWVLLLIFFGLYAPKLPSVLQDHGLVPDGAYIKVQHILSSEFHIPEDPVILLFEKKEDGSREQFHGFIQQALFQLRGIYGLTETISPLQRPGMVQENFAYALLGFKQKSFEMKPVLDEIYRLLPKDREISVKLTGQPVVQADVNQASRHDLRKAELIGIPAAFIILWLAFEGIIAALLPVIIGVTAVSCTMGIMYGLGSKIELSNFVWNVIPMVGLALSIDFALMMVSRFREELERTSAEQALVTTMKTAGRAVLFSAVSVFMGLAGTLFIPLPIFTSVAVGAMTVLTVSVLLTFSLLPALLSVLWPAIQARSKPLPARKQTDIWYSLSRYVMGRPIRMSLLASLLLFGCFLPLNEIKLAIPDAASLPLRYESRTAAEAYQTHFVSPSISHVYMVTAQENTHELNKNDWLKAYAFLQRLESDPNVQRVDSIFSSLRMTPEQLYSLLQKPTVKERYEPAVQPFLKENRLLFHVTIKGSPTSNEAMDWVRRWEREGASTAYPFLLGGEPKYQQEVFDEIFQNVRYVLTFIIVSNFIVLFAAFRSVLIPLKTIGMNLLSLGASFGILVWIFEEGSLGMEPSSIAIMIPVFIFGLVFGISMDYGVFLVSRIFEIYRRTHDNDYAVLMGLASTGRIITAAAAIMIAVTVPFAWAEVVGVKQLGVGIAAAILIDATLIRMVLVPSLMRLLGKWNWWAPDWFKL